MQTWERAAIAAALLIHAYGLYSALFAETGMRFSFSFALSLMMWLAALIYWLESFMARMEGMQPMVLPLAAACTALPVAFPNVHLVAHASATGFKLHFLAAMLAYSLLTLSALHAIFMGFTENALHKRSMKRSLASLPPLLTMESLLFRMLLLGFILLSLTVGSGVFFSEALFGKPMSLDHKTLFAFASWGIFATLLVGRHAWGWRGKRALRWTLAGFALLILAYVGSRFVAEVILGRL
ncbi:cytochrome C assembly family protein [Dechloromonas denitrificans]